MRCIWPTHRALNCNVNKSRRNRACVTVPLV